MFTANCQCATISVSSRRDIKSWCHLKCNNCYSNVCVYKNKDLIHNYNKNFFNASCECGELYFTDKSIPKYWSQIKCKKCDTKMVVKDQQKNIIYNFQTLKQKKQISNKKQKMIFPKIEEEKILDSNLNQTDNIVKNDIFMGINLYEQSLIQPSLNNEINDLFNFIMTPVI